jgi:uncharacterized membrane protein
MKLYKGRFELLFRNRNFFIKIKQKQRLMLKKIFLMLILLSSLVSAATIQGKIYDMGLDLKPNTTVEIDTKPKQTFVSKDGSYSFNAPQGNYTIIAKYYSNNELVSSFKDSIEVAGDGKYNLDIILFETYSEDDLLPDDDFYTTIPLEDENSRTGTYILVAVILLISSVVIFFFRKKMKFRKKENDAFENEEDDELLSKVMKIIKEEDGRTTQKDIRKKIPLSEAKVSLLIAVLEDQGKIRKIKKGRGNIIILNK